MITSSTIKRRSFPYELTSSDKMGCNISDVAQVFFSVVDWDKNEGDAREIKMRKIPIEIGWEICSLQQSFFQRDSGDSKR